MRFSNRFSAFFKVAAVALALILPTVLAASQADARAGGGAGSGSRGSRTFSAPPPTNTAPSAARPFDRTMTTPSAPSTASRPGGFFGGLGGRGLLGGLAAGFLGAGLFGMLFGGGLFGGLGGFSSMLGLVLQVVLIVI